MSHYPPMSLARKVNPDAARSAGPLLHAWARRTSRRMASSTRQVRALASYLKVAPASHYAALGGDEAAAWVGSLDLGDDAAPTPGENEILVLGLPYGGPNGGRDNEGQYFSPMTDFMDGLIPSPPVMYTHGSQLGFEPDAVGQVAGRWYDGSGGWFKVRLDPQSPRYGQLLDAHETGNLRASTGVVPATYSTTGDHIDTWLVGELSLVDLREGFQPVNGYAITKAEFKAEELFEDYYGDPVDQDPVLTEIEEAIEDMERGESRPDRLQVLIDRLSALLAPLKAVGEFGGRSRSDLVDSDFLFPETRTFPVVDCEDVTSAVHSWGRYRGDESFDTFKRKLIARARSLGCDGSIPEEWKTERAMEQDNQKCEQCDEAAKLAEGLKAEIEASQQPARCARCPEAISKVRALFKAGRLPALKAFEAIERFTKSDEGLDEWEAEVNAAAVFQPAAGIKAGLAVAGGQGADPQTVVDNDHMNRARRIAGLPEVKA